MRSRPLLAAALLLVVPALAGCGDRDREAGPEPQAAGCPVEPGDPREVGTVTAPLVADGTLFAFTSYTPYVLQALEDEPRTLLTEPARTGSLVTAVGDGVLVDLTAESGARTLRLLAADGSTVWARTFRRGGQVSLLDPEPVVRVTGDRGSTYLDVETGEDVEHDSGPLSDAALVVEGDTALLQSRTATRQEFRIEAEGAVTHIVTDNDKQHAWQLRTVPDQQDLRLCGDYAFVLDKAASTLAVYDVTADDEEPERTVELAATPRFADLRVGAGYATYPTDDGWVVLTG